MPSSLKKNRKKRGHVSAGYGRVGRHRKHPGGRGNAGGLTHHRIGYNKYHPNYFGKMGDRNFHKDGNTPWEYNPEVCASKLASLATFIEREEARDKKTPLAINTLRSSVFKVVMKRNFDGTERSVIPHPMIVTCRYVTDEARAAIEAAGGKIIISGDIVPWVQG